MSSIWLETDLEPDDIAAIYILNKRGFRFSHIVTGEGNSVTKHMRIKKYHTLLSSNLDNVDVVPPVFIRGLDSNKLFPRDGCEFETLYDDEKEYDMFDSKYVKELKNYVATCKEPIMIVLKPFRELLKYFSELADILPKVTLYVYGSFNFRTLSNEVAVSSLLRSFKNVYLYESFFATGTKNSIDKDTMPKFFEAFTKASQTSPYLQTLNRLMLNWNEHMLTSCSTNLAKLNSDPDSRNRLLKIYNAVKENKSFQMVAADIGVAVTFNDQQFFKPVDISFDPISKYTLIVPNALSKIFCAMDIPWNVLEDKLVDYFK